MSGFLRWLLCIGIISLATFIALAFGVFTELYAGDATWISFGIIALFAYMSFECGYQTYKFDKDVNDWGSYVDDTGSVKRWMNNRRHDVSMAVERYSFFSAAFTMMGMIGTVIGFIMALPALNLLVAGDSESLMRVTTALTAGVCPALYTTLTGMICSLLLRIQSFNLSQMVNTKTDEDEVLA